MAREIKFRAKSLDGIWEYGDLHLRSKHPHIHNLIGAKIYIDPDTVGQFTGLHDKNGKEIYEGDIFNLGSKSILYQVVWHDTGIIGKQIHASCYAGLEHWKEKILVIGNIYDNPELLEGGEK